MEELAASIRKHGLLSPLTVRPADGGKFEVITGQRRLLACRDVGLETVPCVVRDDLGDSEAQAVSLVENIHRADMHPLDKAQAIQSLFRFHGSKQRVADETGWAVATIDRYLRLLQLPEEMQDRLSTSGGSVHVGAMSRLASNFDGQDAIDVYDKISGFTAKVQEEILKRSGGDVDEVDDLVAQAQEGVFDIRRCGGAYNCDLIREILEGDLSESDFASMVSETARKLGVSVPDDASRSFWKSIASD